MKVPGWLTLNALLVFCAATPNIGFATIVCASGNVTIGGETSTTWTCWDNGDGGGSSPGGDNPGPTPPGGGVGGGGGGAFPTFVPSKYKAQGSCRDMVEVSTPHANVAFKAYWKVYLKPRITPDHKNYRITFADGSHTVYSWENIIQSDYAIKPVDGPAGACISGG